MRRSQLCSSTGTLIDGLGAQRTAQTHTAAPMHAPYSMVTIGIDAAAAAAIGGRYAWLACAGLCPGPSYGPASNCIRCKRCIVFVCNALSCPTAIGASYVLAAVRSHRLKFECHSAQRWAGFYDLSAGSPRDLEARLPSCSCWPAAWQASGVTIQEPAQSCCCSCVDADVHMGLCALGS
jgi:hypothetical protein